MTKKEPKKRIMDRHHRLPRSRGGTDHPRNLSLVEQKQHRAWHLLVGNMTADEVAAMLTDTWIDPDYYLVAIPRHRPANKKRRKRVYCIECEAEVLTYLQAHLPIKKVE